MANRVTVPASTRRAGPRGARGLGITLLALGLAPPVIAVERAALVAADYRQGMVAFQQRCSACHALARGSNDLAGPALYGVFARRAASGERFPYSAALRGAAFDWTPERLVRYVTDPEAVVPGTSMQLPEPVPEADRVALVSYLMLETGAADWPRPMPPSTPRPAVASTASAGAGVGGAAADLSVRYPSFWNHLMKNTTRFRLSDGPAEFRFDVYFNADGSVASNQEGLQGFWHIRPDDMFCYALYGLPVAPRNLVECFPVVAMSIPRFRENLWTTDVGDGRRLSGGIVAGRP
jgi:cytochrome c